MDDAALKALWSRAEQGDLSSQRQLVGMLDAAGLAEPAVHWLRRSAAQGDLAAATSLGLREITGAGTPRDAAAGLPRVLAAADAGDGGAALAASVLHVGGVGAARDRSEGFRRLVQAARTGHARALTALAVLIGPDGPNSETARALLDRAARSGYGPAAYALGRSGVATADAWMGAAAGLEHPIAIKLADPGPLPMTPAAAPSVDWDRAAGMVDASWADAPVSRTLESEAPFIESLADFLPQPICDYVVGLAAPRLQRGKVVDDTGGESVRDERSNAVTWFGLGDADPVLELVNLRTAAAVGSPPEYAEGLGVLHYLPGESYAQHVDYIPLAPQNAVQLATRGQRSKTLLIYLNDDFEGGETEFPRLGRKFRPPAGSAIIFHNVDRSGQVDPMTLHAGRTPTSGEKWLISKWFRTLPLRPGPA